MSDSVEIPIPKEPETWLLCFKRKHDTGVSKLHLSGMRGTVQTARPSVMLSLAVIGPYPTSRLTDIIKQIEAKPMDDRPNGAWTFSVKPDLVQARRVLERGGDLGDLRGALLLIEIR